MHIVLFKCQIAFFELHQLWQSGFSRVYSNFCCSWSFEPEIIKIGQSSHKMYSNNLLERAPAGIGHHVNAHKTEYMCFDQTGDISTLNGSSLKLVDNFTYIGSSVSSSETDINTRRAKVWTIDRLSVTWKSGPTDKIKWFFPSCGRVDTAVWKHYMDAN